MILNPQKQSRLSQSKFSSISKLVAYEAFLKEKQQRKTIEQERKNIELNVANLYRQAKRASKELTKTQQELIDRLNKKSQKQQQERLKSEYKRLKQEQLHQLRNNNSLSRYMGMLKRQEAKRRLINYNKEVTAQMRQNKKTDEKRKKHQIIEQMKINWQKNIAQSNTTKVGIKSARDKSLFTKRSLSSVVRNDLLKIENQRKLNETQKIHDLMQKKQQLQELFSKVKNSNSLYQSVLNRAKGCSFVEMYDIAVENENEKKSLQKRKRKSRRKRKNFSQSRISQAYLGEQVQ